MKRHTHTLFAAAFALICVAAPQTVYAAQYTDSSFNYSFTYPDTWQTQTWGDHPGMVVLRNFSDDQYLHGGNVPLGGAEITVNVFPPYPPGWSSGTDGYAQLHALAARTGTILNETARASGSPARVKWTSGTASGTTNNSIWTVVRVRGRVFSIGLDYQTADPADPQYEQVLSDLLASLSASVAAATPSGPHADTRISHAVRSLWSALSGLQQIL